jgi:hypothetical protein
VLLFVLFSGQLVLPEAVRAWPWLGMGVNPDEIHTYFSIAYGVLALALIVRRPGNLWHLLQGIRGKVPQ